MEKYAVFIGQKNQYSEYEYTTKSNLQIHSNSYQASNLIYHRARKHQEFRPLPQGSLKIPGVCIVSQPLG